MFGRSSFFFLRFFVTPRFRWVGSRVFLAAIIYGFYIGFYVLDVDAYVQASATIFGCDGLGGTCFLLIVLPEGFMLRLFISLLATQLIL